MFSNVIQSKYFSLLIFLSIFYLILTFGIPPDPEVLSRYNLTPVSARLLSLTVAVPVILIWYAAFYGFITFKEYAQKIKESAEGQALTLLTRGLGILAIGLPTSSIVSTGLRLIVHNNSDYYPFQTILNNYMSIVIALLGFISIARGARLLARANKPTKQEQSERISLLVGLAVIGVIFVYLTFNDTSRNVATGSINRATYYLPDWLILLSIVLPYLYIWYIGLMAALHIETFKRHVKGIIYQSSLQYLAGGIASVIVASIMLQFMRSFSSLWAGLSLTPLLLVIYALLLIIALGYILVAIGAKKLRRIEEV